MEPLPDLSFAPIMGGAVIAASEFLRHGRWHWRRWRRRRRWSRDGAIVVYAEFAIIDRDE